MAEQKKTKAKIQSTEEQELLGGKAFAELVGCSPAWITKMTKAGKLPLVGNKIPKQEGLEAYEAYRAVRQSDQGRSLGARKSNVDRNDLAARYTAAKLKEKESVASIKELELKTKKRELIPLEEVKADARKAGEEIRAQLIGLPSKIAPRLENKSWQAIQSILEEAINDALIALNQIQFKGK